MVDPRNPQAAQMADESMIRTLAAQAEATWPQERPLLERYGLGAAQYAVWMIPIVAGRKPAQ